MVTHRNLPLDVEGTFRFLEGLTKPPTGIPTDFPALNAACRGPGGRIGPALGWYVVLGGDTGQGKSLLALQLAVGAYRAGHRVTFLSLEMDADEVRARFYGQHLGLKVSGLEPGENFDPAAAQAVEDWLTRNLENTGHEKTSSVFVVVDDIEPELDGVMAMMEDQASNGHTVFVVDYLQLLEVSDGVGSTREVQKISKTLRDFARRNKVLVIALSQYNNESGNDRSQSPHVGALYGGRRISQDSSLTIMLDHSRYQTDPFKPYIARTYLLVAKNRHGPKGFEIPILWDHRYLRARQAYPDEAGTWPTRESKIGRSR